MRQITAVLLFGPPALALIGWLFTRGWTRAMLSGEPSGLFRAWQRYDFWVILAILYIVMFIAAIMLHKI
jgi:hypothetical protein